MRIKEMLLIMLLAGMTCHAEDFTQYVNPFIGTAYTGHTYPGATTPFGMVQVGPDTGNKGWEFCSGYHDSSHSIMGFSHTHLSGTGCPDMGDILVMPTVGDISFEPGEDGNTSTGYRSAFRTETEEAYPGYYKVELDDYHIVAELTATPRAAIHKYTFPKSEQAFLLIDLSHGLGDWPTECTLKALNDTTIIGYQRSSGFVENHWYYFCARFSKPFDGLTSWVDEKVSLANDVKGTGVKCHVHFKTHDGETLMVKVGLSTVSEEGARKNLDSEITNWDFDGTREKAAALWNEYLKRVELKTLRPDQMVSFYTSLYHVLLMPNRITDVDGQYRGWDDKIHQCTEGDMFTNFSLWDTYRAEHPLLNLLYPEINIQLVHSLLERHRQIGLLATNEYGLRETWCMIGNHAVPVVVDAFLKGIPMDTELAYEAVKHALTTNHPKSDWTTYNKYQYYPFDKVDAESVSRTLEHCYDDGCAAQMAKRLGKIDDYRYFLKRSSFYRNLYDKELHLMRGKDSLGVWRTPFKPFDYQHSGITAGDYTEGNAWQYTWHVAHDAKGLIHLFPSKRDFVRQLDYLFQATEHSESEGDFVDVTGLIGQYAHGNEPSHHTAYLYTLAGRPDKTAEIVREVNDRFYLAKRDGLCGNDDCGQMSAWYIFSGFGFYPVDPISGDYVFGAPQFVEAILHLPQSKDFVIRANGISEASKYVKEVRLNGKKIPYRRLRYDDIIKGGTLTFQMQDRS